MLLAESLLGSSSAESVFIEDVFSTWLYTGNGSTQTINTGIDLAGKGGLVWLKNRTGTYDHWLWDTSRGAGFALRSNTTAAQANIGTTEGVSFTSSGFSFGNNINWNASGTTAVSWTFRKQPKFFDIVTYTGNGANRTIAHSLGSVPGCIIVKRLDTSGDWQVYHRSLANTQYLVLNSTAAAATGATRWNSTTPTATEFSLGTDATVNANGGTYVAYLFAHNAGGFGATGADNVISCGSYTGNGSATGPVVTLGYEPQWLLVKRTSSIAPWYLVDNMRGLALTGNGNTLWPNDTSAENGYVSFRWAEAQATGFQIVSNDTEVNASGNTYIYIAIRRGPMRTPTSGTSVFSPIASGATQGTPLTTNFPVDMQITAAQNVSLSRQVVDRLRGVSTNSTASGRYLQTNATGAEIDDPGSALFWNNTGFQVPLNYSGANNIFWNFRRAPGFFDVVCYTGNGANSTVSHNLGVAPELMIVKSRSSVASWPVYVSSLGNGNRLLLDTVSAVNGAPLFWNNTTPTSSVFSLGTSPTVNGSGTTYVAYLFASCPGVSKVGSFTGTGNTQTINCGFTAGARFVLIKRTDSTGDWYVWDSARGIVAANDPYLMLNSTAAEVTNTDWVDPAASGFALSNAGGNLVNINGASYIFLAIA